jgi:GNAT superfamily N-acetyltransferase
MLEIKRSSLVSSELARSPDYIALIRPTILPFLQHPSSVGQWIAVEARLKGKLVGLTLSEVYDDGWKRIAQLYSFIVHPHYRHQGIGRQLFALTQDLLVKEEKILSFEFFYTQEDPFTPALEKILASKGWTPAKTLLIRCHFDAYAFNPSWIHYPYRLPASFSFFSWKNLLPEDRKQIEYLASQGRFVPSLNPFRNEALIDMETSVGLRQGKHIMGWSITQRPDPATIHYAILYIDSSLLHTGCGIQLLVESIRRQKALPIPTAILEINVKEIDPSWWRFIKKRLLPIAKKVERIKYAVHLFI